MCSCSYSPADKDIIDENDSHSEAKPSCISLTPLDIIDSCGVASFAEPSLCLGASLAVQMAPDVDSVLSQVELLIGRHALSRYTVPLSSSSPGFNSAWSSMQDARPQYRVDVF
jgi:hypothetical protein